MISKKPQPQFIGEQPHAMVDKGSFRVTQFQRIEIALQQLVADVAVEVDS